MKKTETNDRQAERSKCHKFMKSVQCVGNYGGNGMSNSRMSARTE